MVKNYHYDAFGVEENIDKEDSNPFRYCAEYYDKETGTIYLRARYYNPSIGRFISQDLIRDGLNWYTYCSNSPFRFFDPLGLADELVQLKKWVDDKHSLSYISSNLSWDAKTKTATLTMANEKEYETWSFIEGIDGSYIGKDGRMYVKKQTLMNKFGSIIDPPVEIHPVRDSIVFGVIAGTGIYMGPKLISTIAALSAPAIPKAVDIAVQVENKIVSLYHGSYNNYSNIIQNGFGFGDKQVPLFMSESEAIALDTINANLYQSSGDIGIIITRIPENILKTLID